MQHAFEAGTIVAIVAGIMGYFVVLRRSAFVAHAFSEIGFAGAAASRPAWDCPNLSVFFWVRSWAALRIAALGRRVTNRDTQIGIVLAFSLGLGLLFISLYSGYATETYSILFGEILGISASNVLLTLFFGLVILCAVAVIYRPLLFASLDEDVAEAKGMPMVFLGTSLHAPCCRSGLHIRSDGRCPPHLFPYGHTGGNRAVSGKTTTERHHTLCDYCRCYYLVGALHRVLQAISGEFFHNKHRVHPLSSCQICISENYVDESSPVESGGR